MEDRELFLLVERGQRCGGEYGKSTLPPKQLERKWKSGNSRRDLTKKGRKERV